MILFEKDFEGGNNRNKLLFLVCWINFVTFLSTYWRCNFPLNSQVCLLEGRFVAWSLDWLFSQLVG